MIHGGFLACQGSGMDSPEDMTIVTAAANASASAGAQGAAAVSATAGPPCTLARAYPDRDGDGHGVPRHEVLDEEVLFCREGQPPEGFAADDTDCDDANATASERLCPDADGDGSPNHESACVNLNTPGYFGCPIIIEYVPGNGVYDCDDTDRQKKDYFYRDEDHDGYGAGSSECWHAESGWSPLAGDCKDTDPNIQPDATDVAGDGVDSDCDGTDLGPCIEALDEFKWLPDESHCTGVDLAIGTVSCVSCSRNVLSVAVENRGTEAFSGEVSVLDALMVIAIAPGERLVLASGQLPFNGYVDVWSQGEPKDCNAENNSVFISNGHCL